MSHLLSSRCRCLPLAIIVGFVFIGSRFAAASPAIEITEIPPNILIFATSSGNVIASVGPDGVLLVGTPSAASTPEIAGILNGRTKSPLRYLVVAPQDLAHSEGDAGWGKQGTFVAMQENALDRLGGHRKPGPLPQQLIQLGVDRPRVAFSEVLTFDVNDDSVHIVHQPPGYSNADSVAHFHSPKLLYLGEVFPGDGYPRVDADQGGKLDGIFKTLGVWSGGKLRIAPARGKVASPEELKAYYDMLLSVRSRVKQMIDAGKSEEQIVKEHPTAEFDERWGHGRVSPDAFVHELYTGLKAPVAEPARQ